MCVIEYFNVQALKMEIFASRLFDDLHLDNDSSNFDVKQFRQKEETAIAFLLIKGWFLLQSCKRQYSTVL